jgi:hypothetical protein
MDRATLQTLTTKLDTHAITLKEAKEWVKRAYNMDIPARTKEQFLRSVAVRVQGGAA